MKVWKMWSKSANIRVWRIQIPGTYFSKDTVIPGSRKLFGLCSQSRFCSFADVINYNTTEQNGLVCYLGLHFLSLDFDFSFWCQVQKVTRTFEEWAQRFRKSWPWVNEWLSVSHTTWTLLWFYRPSIWIKPYTVLRQWLVWYTSTIRAVARQ